MAGDEENDITKISDLGWALLSLWGRLKQVAQSVARAGFRSQRLEKSVQILKAETGTRQS